MFGPGWALGCGLERESLDWWVVFFNSNSHCICFFYIDLNKYTKSPFLFEWEIVKLVLNQLLFGNLMEIGNPFPRICAHGHNLACDFRSHIHSEAFGAPQESWSTSAEGAADGSLACICVSYDMGVLGRIWYPGRGRPCA